MKKAGYLLVKLWIKAALHLYYGKIEVHGLENVPEKAPVLFLPNHQSALLDVLLIAVDCNRKPYFLTRSDVFKGKLLKTIFDFFQMIPIYRIRDGRETLKDNQAIFNRCSELLMDNKAILMFPEANHNLQRRVRPLSKGFTRILFNTLNRAPDTDIQIIPVGVNYRDAKRFPDKVALYFGKPISVMGMYDSKDEKGSVDLIKASVSNGLKNLTTHISDIENYEKIAAQLDALQVNYLKPKAVNKRISELNASVVNTTESDSGFFRKLLKGIFILLNLPMVLIWKNLIRPKVWEPEFLGTIRFGFALVAYPIYFAIIFTAVDLTTTPIMGLIVILALLLFNWIYVRLN